MVPTSPAHAGYFGELLLSLQPCALNLWDSLSPKSISETHLRNVFFRFTRNSWVNPDSSTRKRSVVAAWTDSYPATRSGPSPFQPACLCRSMVCSPCSSLAGHRCRTPDRCRLPGALAPRSRRHLAIAKWTSTGAGLIGAVRRLRQLISTPVTTRCSTVPPSHSQAVPSPSLSSSDGSLGLLSRTCCATSWLSKSPQS
jgi:hypothetical protein